MKITYSVNYTVNLFAVTVIDGRNETRTEYFPTKQEAEEHLNECREYGDQCYSFVYADTENERFETYEDAMKYIEDFKIKYPNEYINLFKVTEEKIYEYDRVKKISD